MRWICVLSCCRGTPLGRLADCPQTARRAARPAAAQSCRIASVALAEQADLPPRRPA